MTTTLQLCTRCQLKAENELLREISYSEERYLADLLQKARGNPESAIHKEASKYLEKRLQEEKARQESTAVKLPEAEEGSDQGHFLSPDREGDRPVSRSAKKESPEIEEQDVRQALAEYQASGELDIQKGKVMVTPRGVDLLASRALEKILQKIRWVSSGPHPVEKEDWGTEPSPITRRYETGDDYGEVDIELTCLNALKRHNRLQFQTDDFVIRENILPSRLCAGIIIDESGSMRDHDRLPAAMETALALTKLILANSENALKIFIFADEVRQIHPREIVNQVIRGGDTDIKVALAAFRRAVRQEQGNKQAYLITDTEPNHEDGKHLPLDKAASGLMQEASRYRQQKIGLNIIMLSQKTELKELASTLARHNLGRVFFTSPANLGEVLIEDYLKRHNC